MSVRKGSVEKATRGDVLGVRYVGGGAVGCFEWLLSGVLFLDSECLLI